MNCAEIRELLLEVDPVELDGTVDSDLGRHLKNCSSCRRIADLILVSQQDLAAEIGAFQPKTSVRTALEAAAQRARAESGRRGWRVAVSIAAAAGLSGLLLLGRGEPDLPGEIWQPLPVQLSVGVDVEAPAGKDVAVFDIEDQPDIVVVWFFDQGDE